MHAGDLRRMCDSDVARLYHAGDDATRRACVAEMNRRDRADAARARMASLRDEWQVAQHAEYLAADAVCCGNLLSPAGVRAGVPELRLWTCSDRDVWRYASEELRDFWSANGGRLTFGRFRRERAAEAREAREMRVIERSTSGEQRNDDRATVGRDDAEAVRCVGEGPAAGTVRGARPVRRVRRSVQRIAPAPARPVSPRRPVLPAVPSSGYTVTAGGRVLARGVRSVDLARAICEATPQAKALEGAGMPLRWSSDGNGFTAGTRVYAFTVTS